MADKRTQPGKRSGRDRRARVEEMRRQQRRAERRTTMFTIAGASLVGIALVAAVAVPKVVSGASGHTDAASKDAKAAGCTGVHFDTVADRTHITTTINYKQKPPSAGNHNPDPLPELPKFYARSVKVPFMTERAVHDLEHGFVIAWYDSQLPQKQVDKLQGLAETQNRFIAVPWTRSVFSGGRHFVLTAWDRTQRCKTVSAPVLSSFDQTYVNAATAPEAGAAGGSPINTSSPTPTPSASTAPTPSASTRASASPSASASK